MQRPRSRAQRWRGRLLRLTESTERSLTCERRFLYSAANVRWFSEFSDDFHCMKTYLIDLSGLRRNHDSNSPLRMCRRFVRIAGFILVLVAATQKATLWSQASSERKLRPDVAQGRQAFASNCAACHGLDAKGSERAPNLVDRASGPRLSDSRLLHIIHDGIPASGMPSFRSQGSPQIGAIIAYLRTLQGRAQVGRLPGNLENGKALFIGKGECSRCHMISGEGGFIASDLSHYAGGRKVEEVRSAIANASANTFPVVRLATVTTRGGEKYVGRVRNEDNFSLQLQTLDGAFQSVAKSDLEKLEYASQPMMPADYASSLTAAELNDLISYLMSAAGASGAETPNKPGIDEPLDDPD